MRVVAWVALLSHSPKLEKYCLMQCIKTSSALRVSSKKEKPSPRIVFRFGKQDEQVKDFMSTRKIIKKIDKKCARVECVNECKRVLVIVGFGGKL